MEPTTNTTNQNTELDEDTSRIFEGVEAELKTRFELLPTELQQVITSSDYQMKLFEIAKKHKLTYEKLGQLELETTMVLLGMTPPDEFKLDISEQLGLKEVELDNVVLDINDQVFKPIRDKLMGIYSEKEVLDAEEYAKEVTNKNKVEFTPKTATPSPYREPIDSTEEKLKNTVVGETQAPSTKPALNLSSFTATPGTQSGTIPTSEKNALDSEKEVLKTTIDATKKPVDPYRELPIEVESQKPQPLSKEFLSGLPTLTPKKEVSQPNPPVVQKQEIILTAPIVEPKKAQSESTPSSTNSLKSISNLKNILSQKISLAPKRQEGETSLLNKIPENKNTLPINEKKDAPKNTREETSSTVEAVPAPSSLNTLNLDVIKKILPQSESKTEDSSSQKDAPKQAVHLMEDIKKDIENLNKKLAEKPVIPTPVSKPLPMVDVKKENSTSTNQIGDISQQTKSAAIFDDGVKFMEEKVAKPGFFSKIKKLFTPKKAVDVLVTPKINQPAATEKVTTMKSMMDDIKK